MKTHQESSIKSPDPHHDTYSKTIFGFWLFLLTDFVLFGTLFACFIVLANNSFNTLKSGNIFDIHLATAQSFILLTCSFFAGLGGVACHRKNKNHVILFFIMTFLLGLAFLVIEYADIDRLIKLGYSWKKNGMLSAFYSILGTHMIHVVFGLIWIPVLLIPVIKEGIGHESTRRLTCLHMLFQFLNIVWIFTYTIVYFFDKGAA